MMTIDDSLMCSFKVLKPVKKKWWNLVWASLWFGPMTCKLLTLLVLSILHASLQHKSSNLRNVIQLILIMSSGEGK
jgi:hypothetical protein